MTACPMKTTLNGIVSQILCPTTIIDIDKMEYDPKVRMSVYIKLLLLHRLTLT